LSGRVYQVVTCFLVHRAPDGDRVLLLRRSGRVSTYQGRWAGVSGYLEAADPLEQAYTEIAEETGLSRGQVRLLAACGAMDLYDPELDRHWRVHLFMFEVPDPALIRTDWEHTEIRWVKPEEVASFETVPGLADGLRRCYEARGISRATGGEPSR
jgi:8-oxo-dGTP pyrophosphatase MutT (NUDIX family)